MSCLLNTYKEDFNEPPRYTTLTYLVKRIPDRELQSQCQNLLAQFQRDEDQLQSSTDRNNNTSNSDYQQGVDYIAPWNLLAMSSTMVAEQLTIVDAVSSRERIERCSRSHFRIC